jgi:hypothetical protein
MFWPLCKTTNRNRPDSRSIGNQSHITEPCTLQWYLTNAPLFLYCDWLVGPVVIEEVAIWICAETGTIPENAQRDSALKCY